MSVTHALNILWSFSADQPAWGVNELGRALGLSNSMVSRLLATLAERRLVEQDPGSGKFRLGPGVLELSGVMLSQLELRQVASLHLRRLAEATGETGNLAILDVDRAVLIDQVPSPDPVRYVGWIGEREPLHCSSPGKVFLAFTDTSLLDTVIASGLERQTASTITDPDQLRAEIEAIRKRGFAINTAEYVDSANGMAAPVWTYPNELAGSVSIAGPAYRLTRERMLELGPQLLETAGAISSALGATREVSIRK
ncbi:MAG: IclR family transcriptional regulator [Thermomicrobiales bacterium]|nr:IclR family transcriptional regulator [Thermomicrobiales bacterium]